MGHGPSTTILAGTATDRALGVARVTSDPYALLNGAMSCIRGGSRSAEVVEDAFRAYLALGLVGPARALVEAASRVDISPGVVADMERVSRAPSGRVSWSSLQDRFESNVERLYDRHPDMRAFDPEFHRVPRFFELYESATGLRRDSGETRQPVGRRTEERPRHLRKY